MSSFGVTKKLSGDNLGFSSLWDLCFLSNNLLFNWLLLCLQSTALSTKKHCKYRRRFKLRLLSNMVTDFILRHRLVEFNNLDVRVLITCQYLFVKITIRSTKA